MHADELDKCYYCSLLIKVFLVIFLNLLNQIHPINVYLILLLQILRHVLRIHLHLVMQSLLLLGQLLQLNELTHPTELM